MNGVTLYTKDGAYDLNNPHDKMVKGMFDLLAQYDNALRSERTRVGKLNRVKEGRWMGGPAPFGYKKEDKVLTLCQEESGWVRNIYEWYAAGQSIEWIKSELDKMEFCPVVGNYGHKVLPDKFYKTRICLVITLTLIQKQKNS